jgi:hypothetical protein
MQKRRFVKRLHEEKQAEDTTGRREQFNPNDEEFFKDEVDIFHEKREVGHTRIHLFLYFSFAHEKFCVVLP